MKSFLLLVLGAGTLTSFLRPRDPAMDEVANILKGILSNLTKHRSLLRVSSAVASGYLPAGEADRQRVLSALQAELAKLASGDASALHAIFAEHPDLRASTQDVHEALLHVVSALQPLRALLDGQLPKGDATVLFVEKACQNVTVDAEALVKAADAGAVVVESSALASPFVDRSPELYFVPATGLPRRFAGRWTEAAVQRFVKDKTPGAPRALVKAATKARTARTARKSALAVEAVDGAGLQAAVEAEDADLFVAFYAPWCPHCQTFVMADNAPLSQLASELSESEVEGLRVLKVDVTTEGLEIPAEFGQIQYIPAVFYVGDRSKEPIGYESEYDIPSMTAFIEQHAVKATV